MTENDNRFRGARIESANRAEATALLIRCDYRVYRPEADIEGEDLVLRTPCCAEKPQGDLISVQLKGRPFVDWNRYGERKLHMLFPSSTFDLRTPRDWFLVPHDDLFAWMDDHHGHTAVWKEKRFWSNPFPIPAKLLAFLEPWKVQPKATKTSST